MRPLRPPLRTANLLRPPLRHRPHHRAFGDLAHDLPAALTHLHTHYNLSYLLLLPVSAVTLRLLVGLPLRLYSRLASNRRVKINPLISAITTSRIQALMGQYPGATTPEIVTKIAKGIQESVKKETEKKHSAQRWKTWLPPLGMLPVWYISTGAVRTMAGAGREGAGDKGWAEKMGDWVFGGFGGVEDRAVDAAMSAGMEAGSTATAAAETAADLASTTTEAVTEAVSQTTALFPPELCATDPTFILPTVYITLYTTNIAFAILTNRAPGSPSSPTSIFSSDLNPFASSQQSFIPGAMPPISDTPLQRVLNRGMFLMAGWMFFIACGMPKAVLVYWCASAASALAINVGLWRWLPRRKVVMGVMQRKRVKEGKQEGKLRRWVRERLERVQSVERRFDQGK